MSTCNGMGEGNGYDKGFDQVMTTNDYRLIIEQKLNRTLLHELNLYKKNMITKNQLLKILKKEFGITLDRILAFNDVNKQLWPKKLKALNNQIIKNSLKEKILLKKKPNSVLNKMLNVSGGSYWFTLGKENYKGIRYTIVRLLTAFNWRFQKVISKQNLWPFFKLGHHVVTINDVIEKIINEILKIKEKKWHVHMHFMDVHDHRSTNNLRILFKRVRFFYKWSRERISGNIKHRFLYVSSVMDVDENLGKLFKSLKKNKILDDTLILITADHGSYYPESPRKKLNVKDRTHYEDLDIPFIMANIKKKPKKESLCDSMDITATFLKELGIKINNKYKGKNIFNIKKSFVISESCGSGNADILRKNVYFTITSKNFKMMSSLSSKGLKVCKLYNIKNDPKETINIVNDKEYRKQINFFTNLIYKNRKEIFKIKGFKKLKLATT